MSSAENDVTSTTSSSGSVLDDTTKPMSVLDGNHEDNLLGVSEIILTDEHADNDADDEHADG